MYQTQHEIPYGAVYNRLYLVDDVLYVLAYQFVGTVGQFLISLEDVLKDQVRLSEAELYLDVVEGYVLFASFYFASSC